METRNGELARVQRERGKTTERVSECEGRVRELKCVYNTIYTWRGSTAYGARVHIIIIIMYRAFRGL